MVAVALQITVVETPTVAVALQITVVEIPTVAVVLPITVVETPTVAVVAILRNGRLFVRVAPCSPTIRLRRTRTAVVEIPTVVAVEITGVGRKLA